MIRKRFDKDMFDKCDIPARNKCRQILPECQDNPDKYGVDVTLPDGSCFYNSVELELIRSWAGGPDGPFHNQPRLFQRKYNSYNENVIFLQFSRDLEWCCLFSKSVVNPDDWYPTSSNDYSFGVQAGGFRVIKADQVNVNIDLFNNYYREIHKHDKTNFYCKICKCDTNGFMDHLVSTDHKRMVAKLDRAIVKKIKTILFRKYLGLN